MLSIRRHIALYKLYSAISLENPEGVSEMNAFGCYKSFNSFGFHAFALTPSVL